MNNSAILGWDLGGAHLKAVLVDESGQALRAYQQKCPLWLGLDQLKRALSIVMASLPPLELHHVITMTGELADIFPSRSSGVQQLVHCMENCLPEARLGIYAGAHGFVAPSAIRHHLSDIASANWHASAAFLAANISAGLFVDIGSTTSDLVLLQAGKPAVRGYSDADRLRYDELVYTGAIRTPVMAVAHTLSFRGERQRLAAEHFATMADVYRLTEDLPQGYDMADTADGAGKMPEDSARRLARMTGRDLGDATMTEWRQLARAAKSKQLHMLQEAVERQLSRALLDDDAPLIGAGAGSFLVRELAQNMRRSYVDASILVSALPEAAEWAKVCLPAYAIAWLEAKGRH